MRFAGTAALVGLVVTSAASAQTDIRHFRWQTGQVLTYRVEHRTSVAEILNGAKVQTQSRLELVKRWRVLAVDDRGTATVQLTLLSMRSEQVRPDGEILLFDSANPDKSNPDLKKALTKFLGKSLAELRVDANGKVLEVRQGTADTYEAEPPFAIVFPATPVTAGRQWQRSFTITLNPPLGTGEKFTAVQTYTCKAADARQATIAVKTAFTSLPQSPADQIPLFQKQPEGEILFDAQTGRLQRAQLNIVRDLQNHQGPNSSFHFESHYREELATSGGK